MNNTDQVNAVIARFDELARRTDRIAAERGPRRPARRPLSRTQQIRKAVSIGIVLVLAMVTTTVAGLILGGIGLLGFLGIALLTLVIIATMAVWQPRERPVPAFSDQMSNADIVRRLGTLLERKRAALPAPAAMRLDAISAQLPLIESQLAGTAALDPLAQDARRLLGKHLPDLIDRYERVPAQFRAERDGDGLNVDERLAQGLDAANSAIDDLGRKLARDEVDAFQTQGRFIETRYREDGSLRSE